MGRNGRLLNSWADTFCACAHRERPRPPRAPARHHVHHPPGSNTQRFPALCSSRAHEETAQAMQQADCVCSARCYAREHLLPQKVMVDLVVMAHVRRGLFHLFCHPLCSARMQCRSTPDAAPEAQVRPLRLLFVLHLRSKSDPPGKHGEAMESVFAKLQCAGPRAVAACCLAWPPAARSRNVSCTSQ